KPASPVYPALAGAGPQRTCGRKHDAYLATGSDARTDEDRETVRRRIVRALAAQRSGDHAIWRGTGTARTPTDRATRSGNAWCAAPWLPRRGGNRAQSLRRTPAVDT